MGQIDIMLSSLGRRGVAETSHRSPRRMVASSDASGVPLPTPEPAEPATAANTEPASTPGEPERDLGDLTADALDLLRGKPSPGSTNAERDIGDETADALDAMLGRRSATPCALAAPTPTSEPPAAARPSPTRFETLLRRPGESLDAHHDRVHQHVADERKAGREPDMGDVGVALYLAENGGSQ
jgi:hypothetical protein